MADVFISYKREDRAVADALAQALDEAGFSAWWDTSLVAGEHFNEAIQGQLSRARCVLVLWTKASHASQWVQAEAIGGFNRKVLVAARLDGVSLQYPFEIVQTADLRGYRSGSDHPGVAEIIRGVAAKVGRAPRVRAAPAPPPEPARAPPPPEPAPAPKPEPSAAREPASPADEARRRTLFVRLASICVVVLLALGAAAAWQLFPRSQPEPTAPQLEVAETQAPSPVRSYTEGPAPQPPASTPPNGQASEPASQEVTSAPRVESQTQAQQQPPAARGRAFDDCGGAGWCPRMASLAGGSFMMGAPRRQRAMRVGAFAIATHEVTFDQWQACASRGGCASNPNPRDAGWGRGSRPVISVSWRDAQEYVQWLSQETGRRYRLPTEAEWEYAARGDTATQWPWGDDANQGCAYANFRDMAMNPRAGVTCSDGVGELTAPVGSYRPNPFGLYDMHGNVFEWVQDCRPGGAAAPTDGAALENGNCGSRVIRGGAWNYSPESSTSWYTRGENQTTRGGSIGFRVATDAR